MLRKLITGALASLFAAGVLGTASEESVLEEGELISARTVGRERINHLEPDSIKAVSDWLGFFDRYWDKRLTTGLRSRNAGDR